MNCTSRSRRVLIVGNAGSGKSRLAALVAQELDVPVVKLDSLYWSPGWKEAADSEFAASVAAATSGDAWVIEGNYSRFRHLYWERVEILVVIECSLARSLTRIVLRTFRRWTREELCCNGNYESPARLVGKTSLLMWAIRTNHRRYGEFPELLNRAAREGKRAYHLKSNRHVDDFLQLLTGDMAHK